MARTIMTSRKSVGGPISTVDGAMPTTTSTSSTSSSIGVKRSRELAKLQDYLGTGGSDFKSGVYARRTRNTVETGK